MNGEFYPGGAFLPSTMLPKHSSLPRKAQSRRCVIAPGELADVPLGKCAIFTRIMCFVAVVQGVAKPIFTEHHPAVLNHFESYSDLLALVDAFNAGERYY